MPGFDRRRMDESSRELTEQEVSNHEDGGARPIEDAAKEALQSSADLDTLETSSGLTGLTLGHYLVGERLGGGAMAAVYRAHDQILDRSVALKVLLPGADAVMQARFRQEARTVSILDHPHIVHTLQVGRSGGIIYIAMELVEGSSLGELLDRRGKLSVTDAARLLAPVAQALAYAHAQGIVHRDVKPSNILLRRAKPGDANSVSTSLFPYPVIPLLSDFGIARALDAPELTSAGRTIGTPAFMAPEQCAGSANIDGRADVYALGAVFYRCLVGRAPFSGSTTQILHAHVYDPLLIPDEVANTLPPAAVQIIARAMMKEPAQRYPSVELMAGELQAVADLPAESLADGAADVADSTMTMASLPVAPKPATSTSRVLVPATPVTAARAPLRPVARASSASTPARAIPVAPPANARRSRSQRERWGLMALAGLLVVLMFILGAMVANSLVPGSGDDDPAVANTTPTSAAVAVNGTPQVPTNGTVEDSDNGNAASPGANGSPVPSPTVTATVTPTRQPPPAVELESAWDDAQAFYAEGDWALAHEWLNIVRLVIEGEDDPFEAEIDAEVVDEMLVTSYIGLVTDAASQGKWTEAVDLLDRALEIAPDDVVLLDMRLAIEGLAEIEDSEDATVEETRRELRESLSAVFSRYAEELAAAGEVCSAVVQVENALRFADSGALRDLQSELSQQCATEEATVSLMETGGSILYSSVEDGVYRIFQMPITVNVSAMQSVLVVNNGAQPSLSPSASMLAFYSRTPGPEGLHGFRMWQGLAPDDRTIRYSGAPEDSRDGPPSWNALGNWLAYGASYGGQASHLFITAADDNHSSTDLGDGKDPAWHPAQDLLVFNGTDGGRDPGLFLMNRDGSGRQRLTNNGNDQRPTWTPDGQYIVFMSKDRHGDNWEVYRLNRWTGEVLRLTNNPAQDGLPTVSPDGEWVAFMSDRGGYWRLWYVSIDGGEEMLLSEIRGQLGAWLEHSIQWIE